MKHWGCCKGGKRLFSAQFLSDKSLKEIILNFNQNIKPYEYFKIIMIKIAVGKQFYFIYVSNLGSGDVKMYIKVSFGNTMECLHPSCRTDLVVDKFEFLSAIAFDKHC